MSFEAAAAAAPRWSPAHFESADLGAANDRVPPPPEIRVDDHEGDSAAAKLTSPSAKEVDASYGASPDIWTGCDERRRSMPASPHGGGRGFVDEPYVFSVSQALALTTGRRRSEPSVDPGVKRADNSSTSGGSPGRRVFVDPLVTSSSVKHTSETCEQRRSSVGASPRTTTTTTTMFAANLDELSRLSALQHGDNASCFSQDSDDELIITPTVAAAGSRFLSLPQTAADCLSVPARRHSVALIQPTSSRILDVIAEESAAVATDSVKTLAASRRYSLSCQLNS